MKTTFSIDMHDSDGDRYLKGVLIHIDENFILRFEDLDKLEEFAEGLLAMLPEIRGNM